MKSKMSKYRHYSTSQFEHFHGSRVTDPYKQPVDWMLLLTLLSR